MRRPLRGECRLRRGMRKTKVSYPRVLTRCEDPIFRRASWADNTWKCVSIRETRFLDIINHCGTRRLHDVWENIGKRGILLFGKPRSFFGRDLLQCPEETEAMRTYITNSNIGCNSVKMNFRDQSGNYGSHIQRRWLPKDLLLRLDKGKVQESMLKVSASHK